MAFLSPVLIAIAIAIKLTSKGPILFKQTRVGQCGVKFTFLKFRSMHFLNDPKIHQDYVKELISGKTENNRWTLAPRCTKSRTIPALHQ